MPSRKRNKGRQRKARAARRNVGPSMPQPLPSASPNIQTRPRGVCNHGLQHEMMTPEDRNSALDYIRSFGQRLREVSKNAGTRLPRSEGAGKFEQCLSAHRAMKLVHASQPEILGDTTLREAVKCMLLWQVTEDMLGAVNAMLEGDCHEIDSIWHAGCAMIVLMAESYNENSNELDIGEDAYWKHRYVFNGCRRSVVKFFANRITCKCLDGLLSEVQSQPKTGLCWNCSEKKDLRELMVCNGCKAADYCCVECQSSDWPRHQKHCKKYSAAF
ncbi:hypothetical protein ACHAWF_002386 [Thalassiosira exigua]